MRNTTLIIVAFGLAVLAAAPQALAQKATELYIPIGKSPGLSGTKTVIGRLSGAPAADNTVSVAGASKTWTGKMTEKTRIYLDRSPQRLPNKYGVKADCCDGALVEMKYTEGAGSTTIEWIKVRVAR